MVSGGLVFCIFALNDLSGTSRFGQHQQRIAQHLLLQVALAGFAQAVADPESFRVHRARRAHLSGSFGADGNQNRWNPQHFDFSLNRDDRAVTDFRSASCQDDHVGFALFVHVFGHLRSGFVVHFLELHGVAHVPDVLFANFADETFGLEFTQ